jgi:hypothetical protein
LLFVLAVLVLGGVAAWLEGGTWQVQLASVLAIAAKRSASREALMILGGPPRSDSARLPPQRRS